MTMQSMKPRDVSAKPKDSARDLRRQLYRRAIRDSFAKLDPRRDGAQPGHVRGGGRQRADHGAVGPGSARGGKARRRPASSARSPSGCGSPCSSPTSRRRWPRAAARRRPRRCAAPARRPRPRSCHRRSTAASYDLVPSTALRQDDLFLVEAGDIIAGRRRGRSRASPRWTRARSPARARR